MCGGGGGLGGLLGAGLGFAFGGPLGAAMGLEGSAASIVGGSLIGGGTAALTGGDPLMGALTGGLGGFGNFTDMGGLTAGAAPVADAAGMASGATASLGAPSLWDTSGMIGVPGVAGAGGAAGGGGLSGWASNVFNKLGSSPASLFKLGSGLYSMMSARDLPGQMSALASRADPFGPHRGQYAQQLSALTSNPASITSMPGWEAGSQAVQRSMAAQGYTGSGNMMAALQKYGGDFYQQQVQQLAGLAGANISPAAGADIAASGLLSSQMSKMGGLALMSSAFQ